MSNIPILVTYSDGSQSIFFEQRAVELPSHTTWKLILDPSTKEWLVDAENQDPNAKPKWVSKLLSSKRSREHLDGMFKGLGIQVVEILFGTRGSGLEGFRSLGSRSIWSEAYRLRLRLYSLGFRGQD